MSEMEPTAAYARDYLNDMLGRVANWITLTVPPSPRREKALQLVRSGGEQAIEALEVHGAAELFNDLVEEDGLDFIKLSRRVPPHVQAPSIGVAPHGPDYLPGFGDGAYRLENSVTEEEKANG